MDPGTRLNHYEIVSPLGEGGMGQVYRADDTRLKRQVAIKLLPPDLSNDPDRLARLEREAQVLAQLEHPNVAGVYGLEEAAVDGRTERFLVMQLAEGKTLEDHLAAGPLAIEEAVGLGAQVALGLEAAHAQGIVHRDLKPANVMLGPTGNVKILDFGLAKAVDGDERFSSGTDLTASPTMLAATQAGVILGTAPYMSPEQARGRAVDRRTDLWALGCLLYEMLAGQRAFMGETATDVIAKILQSEPDWGALPAATPPAIRRLLRRCLAQDLDDRIRDAGDAALMLREGLRTAPQDEQEPRQSTAWLPWLVAAAAIVVAAVSLTRSWTDEAPSGLLEFAVVPPDGSAVPTGDYLGSNSLAGMALDPRGERVAYVAHDGATGRLVVQAVGGFEAVVVPQSESATGVFFSPDGQRLGFFATDALWAVALPGGSPTRITEASVLAEGGSWTDAGRIVFTPNYADGLWTVPESGGEATRLTTLDRGAGEASHRWPHALPGGEAALFVVKTTSMESLDQGRIAVADLATGEHRVVLEGGTRPHYLDSGHVAFARQGALYAAPFDLGTMEFTGPPVMVRDGVATRGSTGNAFFAVNRSGQLAYVSGSAVGIQQEMVRIRRGEQPVVMSVPPSSMNPTDVFPDNRRLVAGQPAANDKVAIIELETGGVTRLATEVGNDQAGAITPDERWIVTASDRGGGPLQLWRQPVDGRSEPQRLFEPDRFVSSIPGRISGDSKLLGFGAVLEGRADQDAYLVAIGDDGTPAGDPVLIAGGPGPQRDVAPSPDGTLVAYVTAGQNGEPTITVASPDRGDTVTLARTIIAPPAWSPDGQTLYYLADGAVFGADLLSSSPLRFGRPEVVASDARYGQSLAVAPDGSLFAARSTGADQRLGVAEIRLDLGWRSKVEEASAPAR